MPDTPRSPLADTLAAIAGEAYTVEAQINRRRTTAAAAGRRRITTRKIREMVRIFVKFGWHVDDLFDFDKLAMGKRKRKLAREMGVSVRQIERYIGDLKKRVEAETGSLGVEAAERTGLTQLEIGLWIALNKIFDKS